MLIEFRAFAIINKRLILTITSAHMPTHTHEHPLTASMESWQQWLTGLRPHTCDPSNHCRRRMQGFSHSEGRSVISGPIRNEHDAYLTPL